MRTNDCIKLINLVEGMAYKDTYFQRKLNNLQNGYNLAINDVVTLLKVMMVEGWPEVKTLKEKENE